MNRGLRAIGALTLLLWLIDRLFRWLHPEIDLLRASLVGLTALLALAAFARIRPRALDVWNGAFAILASAVGSVVLIEAGVLTSRSLVSGIVHVVILAAAFVSIERLRAPRAPSRAQGSPAPGAAR